MAAKGGKAIQPNILSLLTATRQLCNEQISWSSSLFGIIILLKIPYIYMMLYVLLLLWQLSVLCRLYDAYLVYSSNHATVIDEHVHEAVTSLSPLWSFPLNTCEPRPAISQHLCFIHQQRQGRTPVSGTP